MYRWTQRMVALTVIAGLAAGCTLGQSDQPVVITATPAAGPTNAAPTSAAASPYPEADAFIAELMDEYDIPGAGVALVQNREVRYVQGYGVRSTATGEPITPDTLFAIGSITKSFTALGVMRLVDQGLVSLDAPVITYLPDFQLSDPSATQTVTVRQILAQTSGLPGGDDGPWYSGQITTLSAAVDYAATLTLAAAPGTVHIYDNYNYAIAGALIEQVTGQTWPDYMRDNVLGPLDISGETFDIEAMQQAPDHAVPHSLNIVEGMQPAPFVSLAGVASAGALNLSARAMGNYVQFQLGDGTFNGQSVLSAALLDEMHTQQAAYPPQPPIGPTGFQTNGYTLGWFPADFNGQTAIWHNGSIDGFYAVVMLLPAQNAGVAVLSNAGLGTGSLFALAASMGLLEQITGTDAGRDVAAALNEEAAFDPADRQSKLDAARTYQADPAAWAPLQGTYSGAGGTIQVETRDGKLYLGQGTELVPYSATGFITPNRMRDGLIVTYTFETDASGTITLYRDGSAIGQKAPS
ncbi:MAG TPA: serine hydrolase domain-containing protein [Aggregatilinea sp.]|uniref:serine hydrolase domain-containing protein n=1 Tax=Aggregatilinea sp. TaxID=2806333 RepID=UPI002D1CD94F|nr:serine hydrolase domain-containing protein [Aggregatilinea sp.]HML21126.1 serine hydrolase domain-containing protein [Aggregatilinea sp.]